LPTNFFRVSLPLEGVTQGGPPSPSDATALYPTYNILQKLKWDFYQYINVYFRHNTTERINTLEEN